jgi:ankyrin repeat protein
MASRPLPRRPSLEHLRNESRELQRRARTGDPEALAFLAEHHPNGAADNLTGVQLAVARSYGFASWPKLREHIETIDRYRRRPDEVPTDEGDLVDRFLALAGLTYGADARERTAEAAALLAEHPDLATANPWTMAAANEVGALKAAIEADPDATHRPGGPHRWEPLVYAAYARIPGRSTLEAIRVLLTAGADPNAGSLWDGQYPFTVLTGALGGGEDWPNQPEHPDALVAARLLLEAGADPNDTQAIYNRMFLPSNDHLELLFEFGLGTGDEGPWAARLGPRATPITDALHLDLHWAAKHGFVERVRLLLEHGVDPNGPCAHPAVHRTPYELAVLAGNVEIAELLLDAGARPAPVDTLERFVAACMRADRHEVGALRTDELIHQAEATHAPLPKAAALRRQDAVHLMLDVGFDIDALGRATALQEAAFAGDRELVEALLTRGADPSIRDPEFQATAAGWAQHAGHDEIARLLEERSAR